jgi:hypothetical protein
MVQRSLAAFQARERAEEDDFARKVTALEVALAAAVEAFDPEVMRISAFTGMSAAATQSAAARLERDLDAMPTTIVAWCDWLADFLAEDAEARAALLGRNTELINAVTRGKKAGGPPIPTEFEFLKAGLHAWVGGKPFDEIEVALGVDAVAVKTCSRTRDLALKLVNWHLYMIAAAIAELAKVKLAAAGRETANPAVLEILAIALRRGLDTPEKVAFAHRNPTIRTRVGIHSAFERRLGVVEPLLGRSFRDVLGHIDARLAFADADLDGV